ncbi:ABC transporter ATP-binding protein [uncultured Eubacterium sp.]|uniref:ABC transporter ATP-binding protein n=1 Tax=uncultured Eubacterium sp. TaxID=165185 RepID=UPI000EED0706|nr:ABC transporter ATP-binding protein [uncultured Eubacterium sp.]HAH17402.1 ATP-binding protein [Eubacterium sp.]
MFKLLKYLKKYKIETILAPLFKLLEALLELYVPIVIKMMIDNGIDKGDNAYIVKMSVLLLVLAAVGLAFSITAQYFAAKAAIGFATDLRHDLFSHILGFSYKTIDKEGTNTLITRMTSDINQVQSGVNMTLRLLLRSPFVVLGAMIMAFTIDVKLALIFAVAIPILLVVVFTIILVSIPLYKKVQGALDKVLVMTRESITGARVVRAFRQEEEEIANFNERTDNLANMQKYVGHISNLLNPVTLIIINIATIVLIQKGAIRVDVGILSQGAVVALYNYMAQILEELVKFANLVINITKSISSGDRIEEVLEIESRCEYDEIIDEDLNGDINIKFDNVSFAYHKGRAEAVKNVSFIANAGETIGIIGGTGSGKTTLINLIPRFYEASEGRISINGIDISEVNEDELRKTIGIVPQKAVLFKGSIRDNLCWRKKDASEEELIEALKLSESYEFVFEKEGKLDYELTAGGKNLSGGQRQRLSIARALVGKPRILILDDSSSALDMITDKRVREGIKSLDYKPITFIVAQRISAVRDADKIILLDEGEVMGIGTHSELVNSNEIYREIYKSQYGSEVDYE